MDFRSECVNLMALIFVLKANICARNSVSNQAGERHTRLHPFPMTLVARMPFTLIESNNIIIRNGSIGIKGAFLLLHHLQLNYATIQFDWANGNDMAEWNQIHCLRPYFMCTRNMNFLALEQCVCGSMLHAYKMWLCWWGRWTKWRIASIWFELCQIIFENLLQMLWAAAN